MNKIRPLLEFITSRINKYITTLINKIRTPKIELSEKEIEYCINDVLEVMDLYTRIHRTDE